MKPITNLMQPGAASDMKKVEAIMAELRWLLAELCEEIEKEVGA